MAGITETLSAFGRDTPQAAEHLLPLVYDELRKLAAQRMAQERPGNTLQPTALVHEAYLRLTESDSGQQWKSKGHFFAAAAESMRRILVENARRKRSAKRGGNLNRLDLLPTISAGNGLSVDFIDLDDALRALEEESEKKAELIKLRYFAGLSIEEASEVLGVSIATAKRYWIHARAWLYGRLKDPEN
jgi:RNA polymerase sigma factor (TIGR02999 family)